MSGEIDEESEFGSMSDARTALYAVMTDSLAFHRAAIPWKRNLLEETTQEDNNTLPMPSPSDSGIGGLLQSTECLSPTPLESPSAVSGRATPLFDCELTNLIEPDMSWEHPSMAQLPSEPYVPNTLLQQRAHFEARLYRWHDAMQRINVRNDETVSNLMLYYHATFVLMASRLSLYESVHDHYTYHFQEIVRYAEMYYKCKSEQPSFTFEPGAIPALWFVVTKCRISSLRRKALSLIKKAPKKECMWGRDSVAEFATRIIAIEEEGLSPQTSSTSSGDTIPMRFDDTLPPESSRIHELEILKNLRGSESGIRVTRYLDGPYGSRIRSVQDYPM